MEMSQAVDPPHDAELSPIKRKRKDGPQYNGDGVPKRLEQRWRHNASATTADGVGFGAGSTGWGLWGGARRRRLHLVRNAIRTTQARHQGPRAGPVWWEDTVSRRRVRDRRVRQRGLRDGQYHLIRGDSSTASWSDRQTAARVRLWNNTVQQRAAHLERNASAVSSSAPHRGLEQQPLRLHQSRSARLAFRLKRRVARRTRSRKRELVCEP